MRMSLSFTSTSGATISQTVTTDSDGIISVQAPVGTVCTFTETSAPAGYLPPGVTEKEVYDEKGFPFTSSNVSRYIDISMAHEVSEGRGTPSGAIYFSFAHQPAEIGRAHV